MHFDILNRLGVDRECDGQRNRMAFSNSRETRAKMVQFFTHPVVVKLGAVYIVCLHRCLLANAYMA